MDVQEVLKLADDLVFINTGKHLDNLQEVILRGTLQGQKYSKIADESHCSEGHIKDIASALWKLLSEVLGEEVNKSNFRVRLEQVKFSNLWNFNKDIVQIGEINFCEDSSHSPKVPNSPTDKETLNKGNAKPKVREYLAEMPKSGILFDRTILSHHPQTVDSPRKHPPTRHNRHSRHWQNRTRRTPSRTNQT
jgi:hypothetical protein